MKKLNSEWIQAQQTGENRTSKERAGWKTAQQKERKERKEPYDTPERTKKKQPEEKEATRNVKKGRMTLKRSKWRKA